MKRWHFCNDLSTSSDQRKQAARVPRSSRMHEPPTLRDLIWGSWLMLTLITQSNLTLSWFEHHWRRRTFAPEHFKPRARRRTFGVNFVGSKLRGQNPNNCPNARPVTLCNSSSITRNITLFDLIMISFWFIWYFNEPGFFLILRSLIRAQVT